MSEKDDDKESKTNTHKNIASLSKLLKASPAAEELSSTWLRSRNESVQQAGPRLKDLKDYFDSGKRMIHKDVKRQRGVPMWIVVRMCKASWHADGTWPLLASDERVTQNSSLQDVIRSIHPSSKILRPQGVSKFALPTEEINPRKPEATMEDIAASYRQRGIIVEETIPVEDDW